MLQQQMSLSEIIQKYIQQASQNQIYSLFSIFKQQYKGTYRSDTWL